jgi:hypothetical protein
LLPLPDDPSEDSPEDLASQLQQFARDLQELARVVEGIARGLPEPTSRDEVPSSPGERVFYALGQLYRLHLAKRLPVHPGTVSIGDLASVLGLGDALEFSSEDAFGQHHHFPGEVIYVNPAEADAFPWRLMSVETWASQQEFNSLWAEGEED